MEAASCRFVRREAAGARIPPPGLVTRARGRAAARPAIVHVLSGEADCIVGGEPFAARAGPWSRMAAGTPHSIRATAPLVMALYLLPGEA